MGLYRDETGRVIDVPDEFASARGYEPLAPAEHEDLLGQRGLEARGTERGVVGEINAAATGVLSGVTLGGSDYLLGKVLPPLERERLLSEMDAHPYLRGVGELGGALAGGLVGSLARTPTGYLSSLAQREVEAGLASGGVRGASRAVAAMGAEGGAQSVGQYVGHSALEDKDLTAEGLGGALGTGFAFGAGGGGAILGVSNGLIAGRKLFSRVMGGEKAAQEAASSWSTASAEALESDAATLRAAEARLENISKAKAAALRGRNEARSAAQEAALDAQPAAKAPADFEAGIPTDVIPQATVPKAPADFEAGIKTDIVRRPDFAKDEAMARRTPASEAEGPAPLADVGAQPPGAVTSVFKAPEAPAATVATDLESQLAGTKAALDKGTALKDIPGENAVPGSAVSPQVPPRATPPHQPGRAPIDSISDWLGEKAAFDAGAGDLSFAKKLEDIRGAKGETGLDRMRARTQETLEEIRYKHTEELLGAQVAKDEQRVAGIVDEYKAAKKDFDEIISTPDEAPPRTFDPDATSAGSPGKRQAVEILDGAHEEALLRAKHAVDPAEAGQALTEADELEKLLEGMSVPRLHSAEHPMSSGELRSPHSKAWAEELVANAKKVDRFEKASAALTEEMGDAAHPAAVERTKVLRGAEKDSERKMYDRATRATDDAAEGTSANAVKDARRAQIKAQRKLDEVNVQHGEARTEYNSAAKKVRAGEKAKKAALKEDAKLARAGAKAAGTDAGDLGGILEMIDIPGMPKPSDLPIVGPLLGAYLKYRTIKKALGRAMGKVPATADARVATLASQTRDRVARAVDRSIGAMERNIMTGTKAIPPVAGVLAHRIYDDGREDAPKGAGIQETAAARMRELAAYVNTPNAIENDVRRQLVGVTDPDVIAAAEKQHRVAMEYLLSVTPKLPEPSLLNPIKWQPAGSQAMSFARSLEAVNDPASVFERLAHEQAMLSLEAAQALRAVYPRIFAEAGERLMTRAAEGNLRVPMRQRVQLSLLYQVPLDAALDPDNLRITQSVYDRKIATPPPMPATPMQPSIANPVNLSQAMTTALDRR